MIQLLIVAVILLFIAFEIFRIETILYGMQKQLNVLDKPFLYDEKQGLPWLFNPKKAKAKH